MHTFVDPLYRARTLFADTVSMVGGEVRLTYAETWCRCRRLAGGLTRLGLEPGDRVAILAANSHRYLEVYLAVPASGRVVVPLNTRHAEPELRYALEDAGTRLLITDRDPGALARRVEQVISLPDDYERLLATAPEADLGVGVTESSLAGLFYTGGTTGASKGVMLTHRNLIANTTNWLVAAQQGPEDTFLIMAPMFHAAGSVAVLATVWIGGRQVILPGFDPVAALDAIAAEQVTVTLGVPTMIASLAEEQLLRPRNVQSLRSIGHGGSPIATEVVRRTHAAFPRAELSTSTAPPRWRRWLPHCATKSSWSTATWPAHVVGPWQGSMFESLTRAARKCHRERSARSSCEAPTSCRAIGTSPSRRLPSSVRGGITAETSATWTVGAICSSSTARRT